MWGARGRASVTTVTEGRAFVAMSASQRLTEKAFLHESAMWLARAKLDAFECRHGLGYTQITGQKDGISGFPRRVESEYDTFGTAHSSTSISSALGMALAARQKGEDRHAIAVIGDGAMSAGMAYEALNNAGHLHKRLIVILNDNDMSISPNVGAMNNYLSKILSSRLYSSVRDAPRFV